MAAPDMEVIKDIPGYKVILKAVLKSQIQTLVEQLASTTDEESVILTASVVDGTLSHLGSSSGKVFLEDHEDIKSQFLGFCLKHHHKQKQEKERREAQEREEAMQRSMQAIRQQQQARFSSPGRQGYPHPMGMVRAAGPARMRTPPLRHQPYPMSRPQRPARSPGHAQPSTPSKLDGQIIKIEPDDNSNQSESDNVQTQDPSGTGSGSTETSQPSSPQVKPATPSHGPGASDNDDAESSNSTIPLNDGSDLKLSDTNPPGGLSLDSDLSNIIAASTSGDTNNEQQQQSVNYDPNISVKLENVSGDPEMDLEITGVELGQRPVPEPSGSQEWMANVQDYMQGATGTAADMSSNQQGYNNVTGYQQSGFSSQPYKRPSGSDVSQREPSQDHEDGHDLLVPQKPRRNSRDLGGGAVHVCQICQKPMQSKFALQQHMRIHTGEKPFVCPHCNKGFNQKGAFKVHVVSIHGQLPL